MSPSTAARQISADFPAIIERRLQRNTDRTSSALFGEGTAGDVNHIDVHSANPQPSDTEPARIGDALADAWLSLEPSSGPPKPVHRWPSDRPPFASPSAPPSAADARRAREILDQTDPPPTFLETVEAHRTLDVLDARRIHGETLPLDVTTVRLDASTALVCLPHEIFVELGQAIRRDSPFPNTLVITLCNGVDFYVPTARAYTEGSYEVVNSRVEPAQARPWSPPPSSNSANSRPSTSRRPDSPDPIRLPRSSGREEEGGRAAERTSPIRSAWPHTPIGK